MRKIFFLPLFLVLSSCSAATIQQMKDNPAVHKQIVVNRPLEQTLKMVKDMSVERIPDVRCTLYQDSGECMMPGNGGMGYQYLAEMTKIDAASTRVDFYVYSSAWLGAEGLLEDFAQRLAKPLAAPSLHVTQAAGEP